MTMISHHNMSLQMQLLQQETNVRKSAKKKRMAWGANHWAMAYQNEAN